GAVGEGAPEPRDVGGAEALLARPVEDVDEPVLGGEAVGDLTGAVGRAVVDHEHVIVGAEHLAERMHHPLEVLPLVVGRQADAGAHLRNIAGVTRPLPRNSDLAEQLELLADLLEIEGEQSFRVLAYRRAATRVRETSTPVAQLALEGKAKDLPGIGKTIEEKIVQVVERGEMLALTKHRALVPGEVVLFTRLPGLGPKTARKIWQELGITTLEELRQAAEDERLRRLAGLGARSEEKILTALSAAPKPAPDEGRRLLGEGLPEVLAVVP